MNTVSVEMADPPEERVIPIGLSDVPGPEGATVAVRSMIPANPFWLVNVTVELADEPAKRFSDDGVALTLKSEGGVTVTDNDIVRVSRLLVAVTVTA